MSALPETDESFVAVFERVAEQFDSRIALGSDSWQPTFRELNEAANRLAHQLLGHGFGSGDRAAIMMSHDAPMIAAVLGILKAGQIVVALDPDDPIARLKTLVDDARPSVIVTDRNNRERAFEIGQVSCLTLIFEVKTPTAPIKNPSIEIPPEQTAFLVYTSGTTGRPKGVMRSHRQFCKGAAAHTDALRITEVDRIPLFAPLSTGQGLAVLACTLLNGAMLCPFPLKAKGFTGVAKWINDRELTVWFSSASMFRTMVNAVRDRQRFSKVRVVLLATEAATSDEFKAFQKLFPVDSFFVHTLASSEATVIAFHRWGVSDHVPDGILPVGHFVDDIAVSLVGENGEQVAAGEIGEIVLKSRYLANGYWQDPELTARRFSADLDGNGTRQFWTGDLGRINPQGMLEVCGRKDDRIKIRGNRIEVVEIEHCLERLSGVDRAAVVAVSRQDQEPILVAFVKTSAGSWTAQGLRGAVRAKLPPHMMPSRIIFLNDLPYRGNKIDREALRQFPIPNENIGNGAKPRTEMEVLLAEIWADALGLPEINLDDDFFNLGGDSLRAAIVTMQVHAALGIELSLAAIADHPTISLLAAFIDERRTTTTDVVGCPSIVRVPRAASTPLSHFQEDLWDVGQTAEGTFVSVTRISGPLDIDIFKECLADLIERHELLRTSFDYVDGQPMQKVHWSAPLDFCFIDLAGADHAEERAGLVFREAASQPIDLTKVPILRYLLIKTGNGIFRFAQIKHRLICDGFSGRILDQELATLYEAKLQGRMPPLSNQSPLQYADFTMWQREVMRIDSPYFTEATKWWRILFSTKLKTLRLPFRYLALRTKLDRTEGILPWTIEASTAIRLDEIARRLGTTPYIIRLAAFAALMADVTANSTVVIGTLFQNRSRKEVQNIVGPFVTGVPLVFFYDPNKTFLEWLQIVHRRVFESLAHSELPFDITRGRLGNDGIKPPTFWIYCMASRDHSDQHIGDARMSNEPSILGSMPSGCTFYIDEKKSENCCVQFDARRYPRTEMRLLVTRYVRLLEMVAREPEKSVGELQRMVGRKPLRWLGINYGWTCYEYYKLQLEPRLAWLVSLSRYWRFSKRRA